MARLVGRIKDMELALQEQLAERERLDQRLFQLNAGFDSLKAQAEALETERDTLRAALVSKDQELAEQHQSIVGLMDHRQELERVIGEMETTLAGIVNSRSHRMMAPLRRMRAAMLRGKSKGQN